MRFLFVKLNEKNVGFIFVALFVVILIFFTYKSKLLNQVANDYNFSLQNELSIQMKFDEKTFIKYYKSLSPDGDNRFAKRKVLIRLTSDSDIAKDNVFVSFNNSDQSPYIYYAFFDKGDVITATIFIDDSSFSKRSEIKKKEILERQILTLFFLLENPELLSSDNYVSLATKFAEEKIKELGNFIL